MNHKLNNLIRQDTRKFRKWYHASVYPRLIYEAAAIFSSGWEFTILRRFRDWNADAGIDRTRYFTIPKMDQLKYNRRLTSESSD